MKREQKQRNIIAILFAVTVPILGLYALASTYVAIDQHSKQVQATSQLAKASQKTATLGSILDAVNQQRAKHGIAPLISHPNLQESARLKSNDMALKGYRQHNIPGTNSMYTDQMQSLVDKQCSYSGENYVYDHKHEDMTTDEAMTSWMNSAPHKAAILDSKYSYTGIGIAKGGVIVQHFCVAI